MLTVKILGSGCANCRKLEAVAREAASRANLPANFVKVTEMKDIMPMTCCPRRGWWSTKNWSAVDAFPPSPKCRSGWWFKRRGERLRSKAAFSRHILDVQFSLERRHHRFY